MGKGIFDFLSKPDTKRDNELQRKAGPNTPGVLFSDFWFPKGHSKYNKAIAAKKKLKELKERK